MKESSNKVSTIEDKDLLKDLLLIKTLALIKIVTTGDIHALIDALSIGPSLEKQQLGALVLFASALNNIEMVKFLVKYNDSVLWEETYKEFYAELFNSDAYKEGYLPAFLKANKLGPQNYKHHHLYCTNKNVLFSGLSCTPLMLAIANLNEPLSRFLIAAGADLDYGNHQGQTCLLVAFENILFSDYYRIKDAITLLINLGADPNIHSFKLCKGNEYLTPPLFAAVERSDNEVVEILINAGANYELLRSEDGTITIRTDKSSFSVPKEKESLNLLLLKKYYSVVGADNALSFLSQDSDKVSQRITYIKNKINQQVYDILEKPQKARIDNLIELTALNLPEIVRFLIEDGLACQPGTKELLEGSNPNYFFTRLSTEADKKKMLGFVLKLLEKNIIDSTALFCEAFENEISEMAHQEEFNFGNDYIALEFFNSNLNRLRLTMCAEMYKSHTHNYIDITSLHKIPLPEELIDLVYSFLLPLEALTADSSCFSRVQRLEFIGRNYLKSSRFLPKYNDQPRGPLLTTLKSLDTDGLRSTNSFSITHLGSISLDSIAKAFLYALNAQEEAMVFLQDSIKDLKTITCPNTLKLMVAHQFFSVIYYLLSEGLLKQSFTNSAPQLASSHNHLDLLDQWKEYLAQLKPKSPFVIPANFEDVPRDGNCFYHALIKQLALHGRVYDVAQLRREVLEYMDNHINEPIYSSFLISDQVPENIHTLANAGDLEGAAQAYIAYQHSADNIWADGLMVAFASNMLGMPIQVHVFLDGQPPSQTTFQPFNSEGNTPLLVVGNINNLHFVAPSSDIAPSSDGNEGKKFEIIDPVPHTSDGNQENDEEFDIIDGDEEYDIISHADIESNRTTATHLDDHTTGITGLPALGTLTSASF